MSAFPGWIAGSTCRARRESQGIVCLNWLIQICHASFVQWGAWLCHLSVLGTQSGSSGRGMCCWIQAFRTGPRAQTSVPKTPRLATHVVLHASTMPLQTWDWLSTGHFIHVEWTVGKLCKAPSFPVARIFFSFLKFQVTHWHFFLTSSKNQLTSSLGREQLWGQRSPGFGGWPAFLCPLAFREGTFTFLKFPPMPLFFCFLFNHLFTEIVFSEKSAGCALSTPMYF